MHFAIHDRRTAFGISGVLNSPTSRPVVEADERTSLLSDSERDGFSFDAIQEDKIRTAPSPHPHLTESTREANFRSAAVRHRF